MKLLIPFVIVIPGIIAFNLFAPDMKAKASTDNAPIIAKYQMANPNTQLVQVVEVPTEESMNNLHDGVFMVVVFPDKAAIKAAHIKNPLVAADRQRRLR